MIPAWVDELLSRPDGVRLPNTRRGKSFVHHDPEHRRFDVRYVYVEAEKTVYAAVFFGPEAEGPPGCAHGGSIATILDDAMGTMAWVTGHRVVAVNLNIDYRHFVTLASWVQVTARVDRVEGRKVFTLGRVETPDGPLHAEGRGLFLEIDFEKLLQRNTEGPVA